MTTDTPTRRARLRELSEAARVASARSAELHREAAQAVHDAYEARAVRDDLILSLRAGGLTYTELTELTGLRRSSLNKIRWARERR